MSTYIHPSGPCILVRQAEAEEVRRAETLAKEKSMDLTYMAQACSMKQPVEFRPLQALSGCSFVEIKSTRLTHKVPTEPRNEIRFRNCWPYSRSRSNLDPFAIGDLGRV